MDVTVPVYLICGKSVSCNRELILCPSVLSACSKDPFPFISFRTALLGERDIGIVPATRTVLSNKTNT